MKKLLLILLCLPMIGFGQNVYIPNANFKASLVGEPSINTNGDNEIQLSEATVFNGFIDCTSMNISDLTGIEAFTALTELDCSENDLPTLDLSQNTSLTYLNCSRNLVLTVLDVSANTAIEYLDCHDNQLSSLDVSNNIALTYLMCQDNQITALDVSQSSDLIELGCYDNQLTSLDVKNGNNTNFIFFRCDGNPNLSCINVDDAAWSTANWTQEAFTFDQQHYFSNNCPPSAIQEHTTNKELLKVIDLLGRETKQTNQPLFYIYDDGTVEKRIVIE
jgi:uncharacterized protein